MCIIILSSRIYVRRHPNDEIFVLLLTNTGHFLILELMITAVLPQRTDPIPAVIPQLLIPSPRYYRQPCPHYRGITADTAVIPSSPLPCSSLVYARHERQYFSYVIRKRCRLRKSELNFANLFLRQ